jgi:hypothetical protein
MAKKLVKLTESDLHRIIKESINNVLTELDWKTYANAEKKMRGERGDADYWRNKGVRGFDSIRKAANARERAKRLGDAAKQSFDRDYGYQKGEHFYDDDYQRVGMGGDFNSTEEFAPHAAGWRHDGVASLKRFPHGVYTTERTPEDFFKGNLDAVQAYNKAKDEVGAYKKGNYEYQNGKGWTKK